MLITSAKSGCDSDTSTRCALFVTISRPRRSSASRIVAAGHLLEQVETELARDREQLDDFALVVAADPRAARRRAARTSATRARAAA